MIIGKNIELVIDDTKILHGCSIKIRKNKITALIGRTGSGKTSLLYVLAGIVPHIIDGKVLGDVLIDGKKIDAPPNEISVVFQNNDAQIFGETCREVLENSTKNKGSIESIAKSFDIGLDKNPFLLSLGEKQLLNIAAGIIDERPYLFLDEPTSALDYVNSKLVYEHLSIVARDKGVLVVEHNLRSVKKYADTVYVINKGRIVCNGGPEIIDKENVKKCLGLLD